MSIFKRMFGIARAEANQALDAAEDPIAMIDQGIRELKTDLSNSLQGLAGVKATALRLRQAGVQQEQRAQDYLSKAERLLVLQQQPNVTPAQAAEYERLANESANLYESAVREAESTLAQADSTQKQGDQLQVKINNLKSQIQGYENERRTLAARAQAADATTKINKQLASVDPSGTVSTIERMRERVAQKEALAAAYGEIAEGSNGVDSDIDRALASAPTQSAALAAIRQRMALGSGGSAGALPSGANGQLALPERSSESSS